VVDSRGLVTSVVDLRAGRDLLSTGSPANLLQLHPDHPNNWDAWDIDGHYRRARTDLDSAESVYVTRQWATVGERVVERAFGASTVKQTVTLTAGSTKGDFVADVGLGMRPRKFSKSPFHWTSTPKGRRPRFSTVTSSGPPTPTPVGDAARFEVCAHRWIHVAEANYGVGVVNAATYGHDVNPNHPSGPAEQPRPCG